MKLAKPITSAADWGKRIAAPLAREVSEGVR